MIYRKAKFIDIEEIYELVNHYAEEGLMLARSRNALYESLRDMIVAIDEKDGIVGVGGLHITWEFMAEIRSLAVDPAHSRRGIGREIVHRLIEEGKELNFTQKDIKLKGHSFECRICAENPAKGFIPSNGQIIHYIEPNKNENIRIESGVELGSEISPYYDSMIAKLITYGSTRKEAIETMKTALGEYEIGGLETNINLLENIFRQEKFVKGDISTSFIKTIYPNGFNNLPLVDDVSKAFISTAIALYIKNLQFEFSTHKTCHIPRNTDLTKLYVCLNNNSYFIDLISFEDNYLEILYNNESIKLKFDYKAGDNCFRSSINGQNPFVIRLQKEGIGYFMTCSGISVKTNVYTQGVYEMIKYMPAKVDNLKPQFLLSPITGKITKLKVVEGDECQIGQHLLSIEAMKMDNNILAESKGRIVKIFHKIGDNVISGEKLVEFSYE